MTRRGPGSRYGRRSARPRRGLQHWLGLIDIADPAIPRSAADRTSPRSSRWRRAGRLGAERRCIGWPPCSTRSTTTCRSPCGMRRAARRSRRPATCPRPACWPSCSRPRRHEFGRTMLLVMRTLGPDGPEGANMLALGDFDPRPEARRAGGRRAAGSASRRCSRCWPRTSATRGGNRARGGMSSGAAPASDAFLEMLGAERGAAVNTLEAYRRDLEDFLDVPGAPSGARRRRAGDGDRRLPAAVRGRGWRPPRGAPAVGAPPAVQVPGRRGLIAEDPTHGLSAPRKGATAAEDPVGRGGRLA